jgi:hypothetical protein
VSPHAATATTLAATAAHHPTALLVLASVLWLAGYAAACWLWPFKTCRACHGTKQRRSPTGRAFGHCRRCHNTGERLRAGRHAWNYLHHTHQKGTR